MVPRERIDRLVNIWIDGRLSTDNDAGWCGDTILAKFIFFGGFLPTPTGNDQSNLTMINAIRMLTGSHWEFKKINFCIKRLMETKPHQILPLLSKHYYRGVDDTTGRAFTDVGRCMRIGCTKIEGGKVVANIETFRKRLQRSYQLLSSEIEDYESRNEHVFVA